MGIGTESLAEVSSPFNFSKQVSFRSFSFASNNKDKINKGDLKKDQKNA